MPNFIGLGCLDQILRGLVAYTLQKAQSLEGEAWSIFCYLYLLTEYAFCTVIY